MKIIVALSFSHQACVASLFTIEIGEHHRFSREDALKIFEICVDFFQAFGEGEESLEAILEESIEELDEYFCTIESYFTYIDANILFYGFDVSESILREDVEPELLLLIESNESDIAAVNINGEGSSEQFISLLTR